MTEAKRPLKIFLCHAHADKQKVRELFLRLTKDGVDVWLDREKLLPGQDWEMEIRKAVREADVVVVCLSKQFNSVGFRQREVRLALDTAMEKNKDEIFIIPVRLEECDTLESLKKWHWVDLFEEKGYDRLALTLSLRAIQVKAHFSRKIVLKADLEKVRRQAARKATINSILFKCMPFFRLASIVGGIVIVILTGSLALPPASPAVTTTPSKTAITATPSKISTPSIIMPTRSIMKTPIWRATLQYPTFVLPTPIFLSVFLLPQKFEFQSDGPLGTVTTTHWTIRIFCFENARDCSQRYSYRVYESSTEPDLDAPEWKYILTTDKFFSATPGYWYKVEMLNKSSGVIGDRVETILCCTGN